jgi:hypothetical protein
MCVKLFEQAADIATKYPFQDSSATAQSETNRGSQPHSSRSHQPCSASDYHFRNVEWGDAVQSGQQMHDAAFPLTAD